MKTLVTILNIVLVGFTLMVVTTEGGPTDIGHTILGVLLFLVPLFNIILVLRLGLFNPAKGASNNAMNGAARIAAMLFNLILFGFGVWATIEAYPHPEEDGVLAFTILVLLTPIVSALVFLRAIPSGGSNSISGLRLTEGSRQ